jgi:hypothetical protein
MQAFPRLATIGIMLLTAVIAQAQQAPATPQSMPQIDIKQVDIKVDPIADAWKYAVADTAMLAARDASMAADQLLATFPAEYQARIKKEINFDGRALAALRLAESALGGAKIYNSARAERLSAQLAEYNKLIEYVKLTLASVVEQNENRRSYRQLCKIIEMKLREHVSQLEEYQHTINGRQGELIEPALDRVRQSRMEVLNRVLGSTIFTAPQTAGDK